MIDVLPDLTRKLTIEQDVSDPDWVEQVIGFIETRQSDRNYIAFEGPDVLRLKRILVAFL